jgi:hypothetical protein
MKKADALPWLHEYGDLNSQPPKILAFLDEKLK